MKSIEGREAVAEEEQHWQGQKVNKVMVMTVSSSDDDSEKCNWETGKWNFPFRNKLPFQEIT